MKRAILSLAMLASLTGCGTMQAYNQSLDAREQAYNRQQRILDEKNIIEINNLKAQQNAQLIQLAKSQAEINRQTAIGQREAQQEVQKSLTSLYVEHEFAQAIADGKVNTVFVPVGMGGLPLVTNSESFLKKER